MKKFLLSIFIFLISTSVYGEPNKTVQYLIDEPVSMLDWGLYKLEKKLIDERKEYFLHLIDIQCNQNVKEKEKIEGRVDYIQVGYNYDSNLIMVSIRMTLNNYNKELSQENLKILAQNSIGVLSTSALLLRTHFEHTGYEKKNAIDLGQVNNIIKTIAQISYSEVKNNKATGKTIVIYAEKMLLDDKVLFKEPIILNK